MSESTGRATRRDRRPLALLLTLLMVAGLGALISWLPDYRKPLPLSGESVGIDQAGLNEPPKLAVKRQLDQAFDEGVSLLHARAYEGALIAFNRVVHIAPRLPEAYVNMGYALLGLERYAQAERAFSYATELRPDLPNAYYGLALVFEQHGDLQGAMGAMRTYVHRAHQDDPYLSKARAALWEWEQQRAAINNESAKGTTPGYTVNDEG
ncbi:tetratricopeptide repeat protein [Sedimenticola sp.]|uniref:tetratricopeptide repeat protein n=1 Tax=Sedimenticola sp. TaxID=1940285 RepID=UPI003D11337C